MCVSRSCGGPTASRLRVGVPVSAGGSPSPSVATRRPPAPRDLRGPRRRQPRGKSGWARAVGVDKALVVHLHLAAHADGLQATLTEDAFRPRELSGACAWGQPSETAASRGRLRRPELPPLSSLAVGRRCRGGAVPGRCRCRGGGRGGAGAGWCRGKAVQRVQGRGGAGAVAAGGGAEAGRGGAGAGGAPSAARGKTPSGRRGTTGGRRPRRGGRADATERRGGKAGAGQRQQAAETQPTTRPQEREGGGRVRDE